MIKKNILSLASEKKIELLMAICLVYSESLSLMSGAHHFGQGWLAIASEILLSLLSPSWDHSFATILISLVGLGTEQSSHFTNQLSIHSVTGEIVFISFQDFSLLMCRNAIDLTAFCYFAEFILVLRGSFYF